MDKDLFYRGDLQYINSRFRKFCENEENFFEVLDDMLDIATVLPVCEYEYASTERDALFIRHPAAIFTVIGIKNKGLTMRFVPPSLCKSGAGAEKQPGKAVRCVFLRKPSRRRLYFFLKMCYNCNVKSV